MVIDLLEDINGAVCNSSLLNTNRHGYMTNQSMVNSYYQSIIMYTFILKTLYMHTHIGRGRGKGKEREN